MKCLVVALASIVAIAECKKISPCLPLDGHGAGCDDVLFLHVGKAGGGTVWHWIQHNGLGNQIVVKHPDYQLSLADMEHFNHVIVNVREPVSRANSALKWHSDSARWARVRNDSVESLVYNNLFGGFNKSDYNWMSSGISSRIAAGLEMDAPAELRDGALLLMRQHARDKGIRHTIPMTHHTPFEVIHQMALRGTPNPISFYLMVQDKSVDFNAEVRYQLQRVVNAAGLKPKLKSNHPTHPNKELVDRLDKPPWSGGAEHSTESWLDPITLKARKALRHWYMGDYSVIDLLARYGCGGSESCLNAAEAVAKEGRGENDETYAQVEREAASQAALKQAAAGA